MGTTRFYWFHKIEVDDLGKPIFSISGCARATSATEAVELLKAEAKHSSADDHIDGAGLTELNETFGQPRCIFFDAHDLNPEELAPG